MGFTSVDEDSRLREQQLQDQGNNAGGMASPSSKTMNTGHHHHLSFGIGGISIEYPTESKVASSGKVVSEHVGPVTV